jgi:hypothetical protein
MLLVPSASTDRRPLRCEGAKACGPIAEVADMATPPPADRGYARRKDALRRQTTAVMPDTCDHLGGRIEHDTERPWGLWARCLTDPKVPLPSRTTRAVSCPPSLDDHAPEDDSYDDARPYRHRPLRRCPGCGVALMPRRRYCDRCRRQRRRETTRARVKRFRNRQVKSEFGVTSQAASGSLFIGPFRALAPFSVPDLVWRECPG